jgi:Predicted transcriptional regulator
MDMIGKIRRMHSRDKKTKREIARATGLSRNTVAKWLQESPSVRLMFRLCDALDITPSDLLQDVERRMLVQAKGRLSPQA